MGFEDTMTLHYNALLVGVTSRVHIVEIDAGETWHLQISERIADKIGNPYENMTEEELRPVKT